METQSCLQSVIVDTNSNKLRAKHLCSSKLIQISVILPQKPVTPVSRGNGSACEHNLHAHDL